MRPECKYNVGDSVCAFRVHAAVVTARTFDHPVGEWIYTVQYETGEHSRWIAEPNLKPQLTLAQVAKSIADSLCDESGRPLEREIMLTGEEKYMLSLLWSFTREPAFPASRAERIEAPARNVIADYECGFSANNAIIALKRALESK